MIRALIIDDEQDARFLLRNMLNKRYANVIEVIGEADGVESGIESIRKLKPDVVFLDIKMPSGTGFDVIQHTKHELPFEVIFITAHDNFAVKAFQFSAFGYLLKPVKTTELASLMDKLETHLQITKKTDDQRLKVLIENYGDDRKIKKLVVTNIDGFQVLNIESIVFLDGDKNYTHFILDNGKKITTSKTLGDYEELLADFGFFRAHQSTIVNMRHVKGFRKSDEMIEMNNGQLIKLSRHRKTEFMKRFI